MRWLPPGFGTRGKTCLWNSSTGWGWHIVWKMWNMAAGGYNVSSFTVYTACIISFIRYEILFIYLRILSSKFLNFSLTELKKAWNLHVVFVIFVDIVCSLIFPLLLVFQFFSHFVLPFFVFFLHQYNCFFVPNTHFLSLPFFNSLTPSQEQPKLPWDMR